MRFAAKVLVVLGLFAAGIWILLARADLIVQRASYKGIEAYGVPVGILFIAAGVLVLVFWKIKTTTVTTTTTSTTTTKKDGGEETIEKIITATTTQAASVEEFREPGEFREPRNLI